MAGKAPKRPRDPNQLANLITDIATGEGVSEEILSDMARRGRIGVKLAGQREPKDSRPPSVAPLQAALRKRVGLSERLLKISDKL